MSKQNSDIKFTQLFIDGQFVDSVSKKKFQVVNPSNGKKICEVSEGDKEDIDKAVEAAARAFKFDSEWRRMDASKRGLLILKLACLIERDSESLAALETFHCGKPLAEAKIDIQRAVSCFRYYAGWADKFHGSTIPADGSLHVVTRKEEGFLFIAANISSLPSLLF